VLEKINSGIGSVDMTDTEGWGWLNPTKTTAYTMGGQKC
jgi:hypothetical protein